MGRFYLPDQTRPPHSVYNAFSIEEIRAWSTFIYLTVGITAYLCYGKFYVHKWDSRRWIPRNRTLSPPVPLSSQSSHNETNRPALSEMHYFCAYRSALQRIMFNFYSEQCFDMGPLCKRNRVSCLMQKAISDDPQRKITEFSCAFWQQARILNRRPVMLLWNSP